MRLKKPKNYGIASQQICSPISNLHDSVCCTARSQTKKLHSILGKSQVLLTKTLHLLLIIVNLGHIWDVCLMKD